MNKLSDQDEPIEEYLEEEVEEREKEPRSEKRIFNNRVLNHSRDVEARMTYQYPKGNFRFPLISDGENVNDTRPQRKRREPEQKDKQEPHRDEVRGIERKSRKTQLQKASYSETVSSELQSEKGDKKPKTKKVGKGNSRPFRPTEIPSPIYGFRTRPVKPALKGEVENQLNEFLHNGEAVKEEKLDVYPPEIKEVREVIDEEHSLNKPGVEASLVGNEFSFTENGYQEESEPQNNQEPEVLEESNETDMYAVSQQDYAAAASVEPGTLEVTEEVTEENTESSLHEEGTPDISYIEKEDIQNHEEPAPLLPEEAETNSKNEPEEPVEKQELNQKLETIQNREVEPKKKKRSHLPFNVLMLKQDKRQMNQRHRTNGAPERQPVYSAPQNREERVDASPVQPVQQHHSEARVEFSQSDAVQGEEAAKSYSELASSVKSSKGYTFPEMDYLMPPVSKKLSGEWLESQQSLLDETLHNFNVRAKVVNVTQGPSVTRFEVQPEPGVKVNKITNLADDIKLSLAAKDIRIEAPIPGKHTIGIEVPNRESRPVCISEVIASPSFQESESALTAALGLDISGQPIVTDLSKMPHGLIAGATGSGKSVCINSILVSLLYKASPDELKLLLIDPKMVELAPYNRIPHLVSPVITDVKAATAALKWAVEEMERRYELFAHTGVRDIKRFNELAKRNKQYNDMLPYLVIVIDELADLMMMSPADVEEAICRIAQKARACGIHLIIATQRPSVDVITGLIKANVPTRVAFSVSSGVDSRTIIDGSGAERLLGKGDMLFLENGSSKPVRLQGTFVSDDEIDEIINHVREQREPDYLFQQDELIKKAQVTEEEDELFFEACEFVIDQGGASASSLQRRFRIGYNRAARLMEMMEKSGVISESRGSKPRDVLISESELETLA
ncbi:DNA translocase FtsK [Rossellomorea oryzaecorticis]|uniref:DNA translocase FtsK n=2 Tax=Rossellomorea oryzaecorticis TaxID=1396505 RepID=A0ABU9KEF8_9BACI